MFIPSLVTSLLLCGAEPGDSRLAVIRTAPDFTLTSQDDRRVQMKSLRGKVVLVSFVFTTCTGTCPATTLRMGLIASKLQAAGLGEQVQLLSITLDPARDSPAVLRRYAKLHEADTRHWTFLSGTVEEVDKVISAWDMWARTAENGQLDHPSRVFLVDARGRVREIYSLEFLRPAWVVEDIRLLLAEEAAKEKARP